MKKRILSLTLVLMLLLSLTVYAAEPRAVSVTPKLSFSGTTATCKVSCAQADAMIALTLTLSCGGEEVASWTEADFDYVSISETVEVEEGKTYTLEVSGTVGGVWINGGSVSGRC